MFDDHDTKMNLFDQRRHVWVVKEYVEQNLLKGLLENNRLGTWLLLYISFK